MNKVFSAICILSSALLTLSYANATDHQLTISIATPEIKPYAYLTKSGENKGSFIHYLDKVGAAENINFKISIMPWARAIEEVKKGRINALLPTMYKKNRERFLVYPQLPFGYFDRDVLLKRKDDPFDIGHPDQGKMNRVLAKVRSMEVNPNFEVLASSPNITTFQARDVASALRMLEQKRIDLFITDQHIAFNTIDSLEIGDNLSAITLPGAGAPIYLAFSKAFAQTNDVDKLMTRILSNRTKSLALN